MVAQVFSRYAPWDPGYQNLPLEKDVTLILTRVDATIFNEMHEFWRKRRPDITLLILSSKVINIIRQTLVDYRSRLCGWGRIRVVQVGIHPVLGGFPSTPPCSCAAKSTRTDSEPKWPKKVRTEGIKTFLTTITPAWRESLVLDAHSFESEKMLIEHLDRSKKITLCTSAGSKEDSVKKHRRGFIPVDAQCGKA